MKRFKIALVMFVMLFSCLVFSSCDSPYKNMKLELVGELESINLILDSTDITLSKQDIEIEIVGAGDGVSKKLIIQSVPNELISVESEIIEKNTTKATLKANTAGSGQLIVKSVEGNKQISIPINITQKIDSFSVVNNAIAYTIPDSATDSISYNISRSLVKTNPSSATEDIAWDLSNEYYSDNIDISDFKVEKNKLIVPVGTDGVVDGSWVMLKPSVKRDGLDLLPTNIDEGDKYIKVYFLKEIKSTDFVATSVSHGDGENGLLPAQCLTLVMNEGVKDSVEEKYYNQSKITLKTKTIDEDAVRFDEIDNDVIFSSAYQYDKSVIEIENLGNNQFNIKALNSTSEIQKIIFKISRLGFEKQTTDIYYELDYQVVKIPKFLYADVNGMNLDFNEFSVATTVLYDVYANPYGAAFKFSYTPTDAPAFLQYFQLSVEANCLENRNNLYQNDTFANSKNHEELIAGFVNANLIDSATYNGLVSSKNANQLVISSGGRNIKFYLTTTSDEKKVFVSEPISTTQTVMIKYNTNDSPSKFNPQIAVSSYQKAVGEQDYCYLQSLKIQAKIVCKIEKGVKEIALDDDYKTSGGMNKLLANETNKYDRSFKIDVSDSTGNSISTLEDIKLEMHSSSSKLKIAQKTIDYDLETTDFNQNAIYSLNVAGGYRYIYFYGTEAGEYTITISHPNGLKLVLNVLIYDMFESAKLTLNDDFSNSAILNDDELKDYIKEGIDTEGNPIRGITSDLENMTSIASINGSNITTDYVLLASFGVAINSKLHFKLDINPSTILTSAVNYSFENSNSNNALLDGNDYATLNNLELNFDMFNPILTIGNEGTFKDGINQFILFKFTVNYTSFDANYDEYIGDKINISQTYAIKIFIYVPAERVTISQAIANVYADSSLGFYDKGKINDDGTVSGKSMLKLTATVQPEIAKDYLQIGSSDVANGYVADTAQKIMWINNPVAYGPDCVDADYPGIYKFTLGEQDNMFTTVYSQISQFANKFYARCDISITKATRVDKIVLNNRLSAIDGFPYIYFDDQNGFENAKLQLDVEIKSQLAHNKELIYLVTDVNKNIINDVPIEVSSTGLVTVKNAGRAKIFVFAKDAFIALCPVGVQLTETILENCLRSTENIKDLYIEINVNCSNGSYENPYFISTAQELKNINRSERTRTKHYALIGDIFLNDVLTIGSTSDTFTGSIRSYYICNCNEKYGEDCVCTKNNYSIYGLKVERINTTSNFGYTGLIAHLKSEGTLHSGELENINLEVHFDVEVQTSIAASNYIGGLTAINDGIIKNCSVKAVSQELLTSTILLNNSNHYDLNVGLLAGQNNNDIIVSDEKILGASGELVVTSNNEYANIFVGGVVGENKGNIIGAIKPSSNTVIVGYSTVYEGQATVSDISITLDGVKLTKNSALGGVIGCNTAVGKLIGVYATAKLVGKDNVGGLIGINVGNTQSSAIEVDVEATNPIIDYSHSDTTTVSFDSTKYQHRDSYFSGNIQGEENIGGVVGNDNKGSYYYCNAEFYTEIEEVNSNYVEKVNILGKNKVGGFVGMSTGGVFAYCFVVSYRPTFSESTIIDYAKYNADIMISDAELTSTSKHSVGGFAGATSGAFILLSSANVKISSYSYGNESAKVYMGGLVGSSIQQSYVKLSYSMGKIEHYVQDSEGNNLENVPSYICAGVIANSDAGLTRIEKVYTLHSLKVVPNDATNFWTIMQFNQSIVEASKEELLSAIRNGSYAWGEDLTAYFNLNENANGGFPYLLNPYRPDGDNISALTVEAPVDISSTIKATNDLANENEIYIPLEERMVRVDNDTAILFVFNLTNLLDGTSIDNLITTKDFEKLNTIDVNDFITTALVPQTFRINRLVLTSSDTNVVEVLSGGKILLKKSGTITLNFYSRLDPKKSASITIHVVNALNFQNLDGDKSPDAFDLYYSAMTDNVTLKIDNRTMNIKVGNGIILYNKVSSLVNITEATGQRIYQYLKNVLIGVRYELLSTNNEVNVSTLTSCITIAGKSFVEDSGRFYICVDAGESASIASLVKSDTTLKIVATPYIKIGSNSVLLSDNMAEFENKDSMTKTFYIRTMKGPENIAVDTTEISMSVVDEVDINVTIQTDSAAKNDNEFDMVVMKNNQTIDDTTNVVPFKDMSEPNDEGNSYKYGNLIIVERPYIQNSEQTKLTLPFTFTVDSTAYITQAEEYLITFSSAEFKCSLTLSLVPQGIMRLKATNYLVDIKNENKNGVGEDDRRDYYYEVASSKLQPGLVGMLKIDVIPNYAVYDFIEISAQNISFMQVYRSELYSTVEKSFYIRDSIQNQSFETLKLNKKIMTQSGEIETIEKSDFIESYYVQTLLGGNLSDGKSFVVTITPYKFVNGQKIQVLGTTSITLEVQMLPQVGISYITPNGQVQDNIYGSKFDFAINTEARLKVVANYVDAGLPTIEDFSMSSNIAALTCSKSGDIFTFKNNLNNEIAKFKLEKINGSYYVKMTDGTIDCLDKEFTLTCTVRRTMADGTYKENSDSITFAIKKAVIHSISFKGVANSMMSVAYGDSYEIEAYFDKNDISYNNNGYYNKIYDLESTKLDDEEFIFDILSAVNKEFKEENNYNVLKYWVQKLSSNKNFESILYKVEKNGLKFSLSDKLYFNMEVKNKLSDNSKIQVEFNYKYVNSTPELTEANNEHKVCGSFTLSVGAPTTLYSAIPIYNQENFEDMEANRNYILMNDLTLEKYIPFNLDLASFDGNGYCITIMNFDLASILANSTTANLGLFANVYENMIIQNVVLKLPTSIDFTQVKNEQDEKLSAQTVNFGGITAQNEGIITNCIVMGNIDGLDKDSQFITYNSSIAESSIINDDTALKFTFDKNITVNIAGLVATNSGYITNSKVMASISTYGNLAGVVCNNSGKIASSKFIGGKLNNKSSLGALPVAGFVLKNTGKISMSYSEGMRTSLDYLQSTKGGISSSGNVGGFVYDNSGSIEDCYADVYIDSNDTVSGFAFNNTGKINRIFSTSKFVKVDNTFFSPIFATNAEGNGVISNSYYIADSINYSQEQGIKLSVSKFSNAQNFNKFCFDDQSIWFMRKFNGQYKPTLVSANVESNPTKQISSQALDAFTGETTYTYSGMPGKNNYLGSLFNPYLVYSAESWNEYFSQANKTKSQTSCFRIVCDINLNDIVGNPNSSGVNFVGQIEGNNMSFENLVLYKSDSGKAIGLFATINQKNSIEKTIVRNLTIECTSINASKVESVGSLAGIITGACIYNIDLIGESTTLLGRNIVGGLAGMINGDYTICDITSNLSANSGYRNITNSKYVMYSRTANNISSVAYSGAIAGIIDGYLTGSENVNDATHSYKMAHQLQVYGNLTIIGETVGSAFGMIGENSKIEDLYYEFGATTRLKGVYYSGGLVGENRGYVINSKIIDNFNNKTSFDGFAKVSGGFVGLNNGGILDNVSSNINVINDSIKSIVGGLVGRNINGAISNGNSKGMVFGKMAGGLVGAHSNPDSYYRNGLATSDCYEILRKTAISSINGEAISSFYINCDVSGIIWDTTYFSKYFTINSDDTILYQAVLGAVIGATEGKILTTTETKNMFLNTKYNPIYKHGLVLSSQSLYIDGDFPLLPVAANLSNINNWESFNGYNGFSVMNYDYNIDDSATTPYNANNFLLDESNCTYFKFVTNISLGIFINGVLVEMSANEIQEKLLPVSSYLYITASGSILYELYIKCGDKKQEGETVSGYDLIVVSISNGYYVVSYKMLCKA